MLVTATYNLSRSVGSYVRNYVSVNSIMLVCLPLTKQYFSKFHPSKIFLIIYKYVRMMMIASKHVRYLLVTYMYVS